MGKPYNSRPKMKQLILNRPNETYIFRYEIGKEYELLEALVYSAKDKKTRFDWFDAAVISFKLKQSLIKEADELLNDSF